MPDGDYRLGRHAVTKCLGGVRLADGTLAGSTLTMDQALRNLVEASAWSCATPRGACPRMRRATSASPTAARSRPAPGPTWWCSMRGCACAGVRRRRAHRGRRSDVNPGAVVGRGADAALSRDRGPVSVPARYGAAHWSRCRVGRSRWRPRRRRCRRCVRPREWPCPLAMDTTGAGSVPMTRGAVDAVIAPPGAPIDRRCPYPTRGRTRPRHA